MACSWGTGRGGPVGTSAGRLDGEVEADCRAGLARTWLTKICE